MNPRLRSVWVLAAALMLVVAGCGTSADPDTWEEAEQDDRFLDGDYNAKSAVEQNFMDSCMLANRDATGGNLTDPEARVLCSCSFSGLREPLTLDQFQSLDRSLRESPNPSDLDDEPEDLWDDIAEDIFRSCARRVDS